MQSRTRACRLLFGNAGAPERRAEPSIAVGGCSPRRSTDLISTVPVCRRRVRSQDRSRILADWLGAAEWGYAGRSARTEHFAGHLPLIGGARSRRRVPSDGLHFVVRVPASSRAVRGPGAKPRRPGEIVAEIEQLARDGVREITLLGQNVNSWGRDLTPTCRPSSVSCCARATRSPESSASASRARIRRTSGHR